MTPYRSKLASRAGLRRVAVFRIYILYMSLFLFFRWLVTFLWNAFYLAFKKAPIIKKNYVGQLN